MNRLVEKYQKTVIESLMKQFNYSSVMQCPKIEKVVINMGVGAGRSSCRTDSAGRPEAGHHEGEEVHRELQAA